MKTLMPTRLQTSTASRTPSRRGSTRERRPTKVMSVGKPSGKLYAGSWVFPWGGKAVGKAEHALAEPAEVRVRLDELVLELVAVDDLVRGTLEHEHEGVRGARLLVDGLLPLVGGVELVLEHLGVALAVNVDVLQALHALDDANVGGVAGAADAEQVQAGVLHALHHGEDGTVIAPGQEAGVVAQGGNHLQLLEGRGGDGVVGLASGDG
eukprot:1192648-Prorocentrum_minimum.AAC.2